MKKDKDQNNKAEKKLFQAKNVKNLASGIFYYNSLSILGPLVVFIGSGLLLDKLLNTKPYLTVAGLVIAFLSSNFLILRKVKKLTQEAKNYNEKLKDQAEETEKIN